MMKKIPLSSRIVDLAMDYEASLDTQKAVKSVITASKFKSKFYTDREKAAEENASITYYSEFLRLASQNIEIQNQKIRLRSSDKVVTVGEVVQNKASKHPKLTNQISVSSRRFKTLEKNKIREMEKSKEIGLGIEKDTTYELDDY